MKMKRFMIGLVAVLMATLSVGFAAVAAQETDNATGITIDVVTDDYGAQTSEPIDDFQIEGTIAYLAHGTSWSIVDVSDPANPISLSQTSPEMPDGFEQLDSVWQSTVNVTDERLHFYVRYAIDAAIWTYDVSDPAVPVLLGSDTLYGGLVGIGNNTAYTLDAFYYYLYDLTDPNQIIEVQSEFNVPTIDDSWITGIDVFNGVTYVEYFAEGLSSWIGADDERLQALLELVWVILATPDFGYAPYTTTLNSELDTFREIFQEKGLGLPDSDHHYPLYMSNVSVTEDNILYLSISYFAGNHTLTFDLNETNTLTDMVTTMELIEDVTVETIVDDIAYASTYYPTATIMMLDISDRSNPIELNAFDGTITYPPFNGDDLLYDRIDNLYRVMDDALYVLGETSDGSGILRWDATNPITPTVIPTNSIDFLSLHSVGNTVYSIVEGELTIVDVTDSTQPIHLGSYSPVTTMATTSISSSFYLNSSVDAVEERADGTIYLNSSDLEIGRDAGANQLIGLHYQNVNIPPNVTITDAKLIFTVDEPQAEPASGTFFGESVGNTQPFTDTLNNLSNRERTTTSITWNDIPTWDESDVGSRVESPSLSPIIQEIVDGSGWSAGNSLSIIIEGEGRRSVASYGADGANAPILQIEYSTAEQANIPLSVHFQPTMSAKTSPLVVTIVGMFMMLSVLTMTQAQPVQVIGRK